MAGVPSFSQSFESSSAMPCNLALPGSLTNALVCLDNATAGPAPAVGLKFAG
jgi:hypothetical protein